MKKCRTHGPRMLRANGRRRVCPHLIVVVRPKVTTSRTRSVRSAASDADATQRLITPAAVHGITGRNRDDVEESAGIRQVVAMTALGVLLAYAPRRRASTRLLWCVTTMETDGFVLSSTRLRSPLREGYRLQKPPPVTHRQRTWRSQLRHVVLINGSLTQLIRR